jgi:hypothetical protein
MKIEALLDKKEARQFQIIRRTLLAGGRISEAKLSGYLQVSKASFEKDLQELAYIFTSFGKNIQFTYDGQWLTLRLADEFSAAELYRLLIKESLKFQIIDYLYRYKEFTIAQLTTKFSISESSLFRKIKELNVLLKEFALQIKNGQLQGAELQIRFFYFQLYWHLLSYEKHQAVTMTSQNLRVIHALEKALTVSFSEYSELQISLWLTIAKKRLNTPVKDYQEFSEKMTTFQEDPLYKQTRQFVLRFFNQYPLEFDEGEAMLHFVFLLTGDILSQADFTEYALLRKRRSVTALADTIVLETIVLYYRPQRFEPYLEKKIVYYLAQIHSKLYFLKGEFSFFDYKRMIAEPSIQTKPVRYAFVKKLLAESLSCFNQELQLENSLQLQALVRYFDILAVIDDRIVSELLIGIDLDLAPLEAERLSQLLFSALKGRNRIQIEQYQAQKHYRFIITNHPPGKRYLNNPKIYVLSELGSAYDLQQLNRIIQEL